MTQATVKLDNEKSPEMGAKLISTGDGIQVSIPMKLKRRQGRKEIIAPTSLRPENPEPESYQKALVTTLARAYHWKELLDSGKFKSITELADAIGLDRSYTTRILRLTLLAPDIVEAILEGREADGVSFRKLIKQGSVMWEEQRNLLVDKNSDS